jgi:hypothetical protein
MEYVKDGWVKIKKQIDDIDKIYDLDETKKLLLSEYYYKDYFGKSKNRTLIKENPKLYKSIYYHTGELESLMKEHNRYKGWYSFTYRLKFITEINCDVEKLKCDCGTAYTWNKYCRRCPEYHRTNKGKTMSPESKLKCRTSTLEYLSKVNGQLAPRYNVNSIPIIEEYGKRYGYNFKHAENGGEYHIKELGYFVDGYDKDRNVVIEIDEKHHFNIDGSLKKEDIDRENEIRNFIGCEFIRIKYEK